MVFADRFLIMGLEDPRGPTPNGNPWHMHVGHNYQPGIWMLARGEIDAEIARQQQVQQAEQAQSEAKAREAAQALLKKYDRNHNGVLDADEKEQALDDPAFLEAELDVIDANHNGWLDASELAYFDANHNGVLDPKEQAGIDIVQHLFAVRLLQKFDANGDGRLDRSEFENLLDATDSGAQPKAPSFPGPRGLAAQFPDDNHDGYVDVGEFESFLKLQTWRGLRLRGVTTADLLRAGQSTDARQLFKAMVEFYWQHAGDANRPKANQ
jgi:Ca2+-binding EF-hand superfamily protein